MMRLNREQRRMLERMGLVFKPIEGVQEVQIKLAGKTIIIRSPEVQVLEIKGGGKIYYVTGVEEEVPGEQQPQQLEISQEDIDLVVLRTGASPEEAKRALIESGGDIAKAILSLSQRKR
ncbi:nascent polypeptide-associated complex protein [Thermofilum pendens]|uniref:Nascent polypeptide-associated complex protein n=1 Tax=Thermofilum pendens (strain DSM 2475 / Hrk 5) TaxID=368408 RepID=A1RWP9_THEPD|nr:nascent polypeptide-associated complex protein [Thermofilum pendens]ABL77629.1 Nascent polypeptide associated complex NAC [Thermofilum pendens Hrk 5]